MTANSALTHSIARVKAPLPCLDYLAKFGRSTSNSTKVTRELKNTDTDYATCRRFYKTINFKAPDVTLKNYYNL